VICHPLGIVLPPTFGSWPIGWETLHYKYSTYRSMVYHICEAVHKKQNLYICLDFKSLCILHPLGGGINMNMHQQHHWHWLLSVNEGIKQLYIAGYYHQPTLRTTQVIFIMLIFSFESNALLKTKASCSQLT